MLSDWLLMVVAYGIHFIIAGCLVLLEDLAYLLWILVAGVFFVSLYFLFDLSIVGRWSVRDGCKEASH